MRNKKIQTINTYNASASKMADKYKRFNREDDVERGFSYVKKINPFVLEIGCGNGREVKEILKRTKNYLGIDVSASMIAIASKYVPKAKFKVVDIEKYSFPQKGIDLIFAFASLLHSDIENVQKILLRAHSALNKDGIFYISLKYGTYHEETKADEFGTRTYFFYTPEDIKTLSNALYEVIFEAKPYFQNQNWLTMILKKI